MRVCVVAEYYPDAHDSSHGIWAHRQAFAARDAGAEVRVLALHRPLPPLDVLRAPSALPGWLRAERRQPHTAVLDGIQVRYVRFVSPPRPVSYPAWGAWAAPFVGSAMRRLYSQWPFDLVHAHYAVPAGRAAEGFARSRGLPMVVSVHGADVLDSAQRSPRAARTVARVLDGAASVLCNSRYTLERSRALGVTESRLRVVRLGASAPDEPSPKRSLPSIVSSGYLVPRKRHADVLEALALLSGDLPSLRYVIVGDGPERSSLERLATELDVRDRVDFRGRLSPERALQEVASCHLLVLPSVDEAFGVVYAEAMAAGVPAIGCAGEGGPEEIASLGEGLVTVPPRDPQALAETLRGLFSDRPRLEALGESARETARRHLSWERCGQETVSAYRDAVERGR